MHELVYGQIWVKIKALDSGNRDYFAP